MPGTERCVTIAWEEAGHFAESGGEWPADNETRRNKWGWIYWIGANSGPIKVGFTGEAPARRLSGLQCGNPQILHLWGVVKAPRPFEERLHGALNESRVRGEWFQRDTALELLAELRFQLRVLGHLPALAEDFRNEQQRGGRL